MQTPDKNLGVRKNLYDLEFRFITPDNRAHNPTKTVVPDLQNVYTSVLRHYMKLGTRHNPIVID